MTAAGLTAVVEPDPLAALIAVLRPEFRRDVIVPAAGDPILGTPACVVGICTRPSHARGLCQPHLNRWRAAGSPDLAVWQATDAMAVRGRDAALSICRIPGCGHGQAGAGLCSTHLLRWRRAGRPDVDAWVEDQGVVATVGRPCRVNGCSVLADGSEQQLCRTHLHSWSTRGRPPLDDFVADHLNVGAPGFRIGPLPQPLRSEIAYGLQRRADDRRVRIRPSVIARLIKFLAASGHTSLMDLPIQVWREQFQAANGTIRADHFLLFTFESVQDLLTGSGWETEYARDVWLLRRLGFQGAHSATMRFEPISQPWFRALAKRWIRWRITTGLGISAAQHDLGSLKVFSRCLAELEPASTGVGTIDRAFLERYIAWLWQQPIGAKVHEQRIGSIRQFLRHIHQHGWAPLPVSAILYPEDSPRRKPLPGRALSEYVMAQLENASNLALFAATDCRTITEIMMRAGLSVGDACQLRLNCLVRDAQGAPYLRYLNHKMNREASVPIDEELAESITAQQASARARWPDPACLFPRRIANPDGAFPIGRSAYGSHLTRWLSACSIRDENGSLVNVTPHQWRHTYGTRLINADVPQHVVKQLLDHTSDQMTAHYARLNQTTVRRHWEQAHRVNIAGEPVPVDPTSPLAEAMWVKEGLARAKMALPNGFCTLPLQKSCPHANACLTCPLFVTTTEFLPEHRRQLTATRQLIEVAAGRGHERLVESNGAVERNLLRIIQALEHPTTPCCGNADTSGSCRCQKGKKDAT